MIPMTPDQRQAFRWEREIDERNRPLTDDELDAIMPKDGYKVLECLSTVYIDPQTRSLLSNVVLSTLKLILSYLILPGPFFVFYYVLYPCHPTLSISSLQQKLSVGRILR